MDRETNAGELRCKPGDVARVVRSANSALVGRIVTVAQLYGDGRWECILVGDPVLGMADDGTGLVLTRDWLFPDPCLEPRLAERPAASTAFSESLLC
ncbi:hypothetical protein WM29_22850 [Burkholderia ubonensis]|nr:hypothetical protein WM29_22850 [Burkholderia ubonensis]